MAANQNVTQLTQQTVSAAASSLFYAVTGGTTDTGLPLSVLVNNLGLTGVPTVPTAAPGTNTTQIASTAYVVTSFAPLASPTFTGTPTLPTGTIAVTQTAGNNSTAVATTAFVVASFAPLASPTFTGVPAAPTASTGTSTTQVATTAFVANTMASPPSIGITTPNAIHATTIGATGAISPSTTAGIVGTTLADNAAAGSIGEYITATASGVSLTNATPANITSISLTAGDWDVTGQAVAVAAGSTVLNNWAVGINTVSATMPTATSAFGITQLTGTLGTGTNPVASPMVSRVNVSTTTTVFLVANAAFTTSTCTANGVIRARRVR
jgi:hypothetical protein